ncbi:hypothetical protein BC826DRAFT_195720 [Russula brevipes]|nr:hypothetical protein BC826DRAFT_195720 [Russula brevipes]
MGPRAVYNARLVDLRGGGSSDFPRAGTFEDPPPAQWYGKGSLSDRIWALWRRVKSADSSTGARSMYKTWHPLSGRACALCRHAFSAEASVGPRSGYNARPASSRGGFSFSSEGRSGSLARRRLTSFWRASNNFLRCVSAISVLSSSCSGLDHLSVALIAALAPKEGGRVTPRWGGSFPLGRRNSDPSLPLVRG